MGRYWFEDGKGGYKFDVEEVVVGGRGRGRAEGEEEGEGVKSIALLSVFGFLVRGGSVEGGGAG